MISIIGSGKVGSAIAFLAAATGTDDIVLVNKPRNKAIGESLDIVNAISEKTKISISGTDEFAKIRKSDVVVITASTGKIIEERTDLLPYNIPIIQEISRQLRRYADDSKIIVVTNPVDIITYQILKETEFPSWKVIGMGSSLDSNRFRYLLSRELGINSEQIEGIVMGEHGSTMVPIFSSVKLKGKSFELKDRKRKQISFELRNYWRYLIAYKGESVFGAAKNTFDMVRAILFGEELSVPAQVYLDGEYGLSDLCLGVPVIIDKKGIKKITELSLKEEESALLSLSANKIKEIINKIKVKRSY